MYKILCSHPQMAIYAIVAYSLLPACMSSADLLVWSTISGGFYTANVDGSNVSYQSASGEAIGIAVDNATGRVYWSNSDGSILSSELDGSDQQEVFNDTDANIAQLIVHKGKLFFTVAGGDTQLKGVYRLNLNGTGLTQIGDGVRSGTAAIHHANDDLYYQVLDSNDVERAVDTSGTNPSRDLPNQLGSIHGMSVDELNDHLYFTTHFSIFRPGGIYRSELDGAGVTFLGSPTSLVDQVDSIHVDAANDTIYWLTSFGTLGRMDLDGSNVVTLYHTAGSTFSLAFYSPVPEHATVTLFSIGMLSTLTLRRRIA